MRFEVVIIVNMKISVLWYIILCNLLLCQELVPKGQ